MTETITLKPHPYSLDYDCPVPWPSQEGSINQDFPFHSIKEESPQEFVVRRYIETLWLPESIMPLRQLVTSLRRFIPSNSLTQELHAALKPILLSVRAIQDKYHNQLPQILQDGGGAGEIEETMMWYSWSRENFHSDGNGDLSDAGRTPDEDIGKKAWMEKLERREVQIQILLYFHLLSLPSPSATISPKKRRKQRHGPPSPIKHVFPPTASVEAITVNMPTSSVKPSNTDIDENLGMEDRLEFLMDRLSIWQLMDSLTTPRSFFGASSQPPAKDQRDWMQIFCEDIVEPLFRDQVPEMCDLLRTKVFPHRLFSEDSDNEPSPPPILPTKKSKKAARPPSPLRLQELGKTPAARSRAGSTQSSVTPTSAKDPGLQRHRSRSRSVSVTVEEVRARGANRGGVTSSKSLWKGEVEMKRTSSRGSKLFKSPAVDVNKMTHQNSHGGTVPLEARSHTSEPESYCQARDPKLLAADTPVKRTIKQDDAIPSTVMDSPDELLLMSNRQWHGLHENDDEPDKEFFTRPTPVFAADTPIKKHTHN